MGNRDSEGDMTHPFPTYLLLCYFHTASVADDSTIADSLIFAAIALIILGRSEDLFEVAFYLIIFIIKSRHISLYQIVLNYSNVTLSPKPLNSWSNTLRDSGMPGVGIGSPLTIAS